MNYKTLGIDIGSTTVKIAILDENENLIFADYKRHFANIQETLADLLQEAFDQYGEMTLHLEGVWQKMRIASSSRKSCATLS